MWYSSFADSAPKAVKTKFVPVYKSVNGKLKCNLSFLCGKCYNSGVYFIKSNRTGQVIYIGYSERSLYKTILRHFQTWNDKQQQRFVYSKTGYTIRVILTTPGRAALLEKHLIQKFKPRDNELKYKDYLTDTENARAAQMVKEAPTVTPEELDDIEVPF